MCVSTHMYVWIYIYIYIFSDISDIKALTQEKIKQNRKIQPITT